MAGNELAPFKPNLMGPPLRLQSLALNRTPERVAMGLLRFAQVGAREDDGAVRIPPMTHELLSGYIGTSREIVTSQMNQLRRQGFVRYSRKAIQIYTRRQDLAAAA